MTESYPSDSTLNAMSGLSDPQQEVLYLRIAESPYYTSFYKMLYRLLDVARRAGDLRVYKDSAGALKFGARAGRWLNGDAAVNYAGATNQSLTDNAINYIYLTAAGVLTKNTTGFPVPSVTPHLPLATIATGTESVGGVSGYYAHEDITDYRARVFSSVPGASGSGGGSKTFDWQASVLDELNFVTSEPAGPTLGDRYLNTATGNSSQTGQAVVANRIYEWNGTSWTESTPTEGFCCLVEDRDMLVGFNGSAWVDIGTFALLAEAKTFFAATDATGAEMEKLTDTSDAGGLHKHERGGARTTTYTTATQVAAHTWLPGDTVVMNFASSALSSGIVINQPNCVLKGNGKASTTITYGAACSPIIVTGNNCTVREFTLNWDNGGSRGGTNGQGIRFLGCTGGQAISVAVTRVSNDGICCNWDTAPANLVCIECDAYDTGGDGFAIGGNDVGRAAECGATLIRCNGYSNKTAYASDGASIDGPGRLIVDGGSWYDNGKAGICHLENVGGYCEVRNALVYGNEQITKDAGNAGFEIYAHRVFNTTIYNAAGTGISIGGGWGAGIVSCCRIRGAASSKKGILIGSGLDCWIDNCEITGFNLATSGEGYAIYNNGNAAYVLNCHLNAGHCGIRTGATQNYLLRTSIRGMTDTAVVLLGANTHQIWDCELESVAAAGINYAIWGNVAYNGGRNKLFGIVSGVGAAQATDTVCELAVYRVGFTTCRNTNGQLPPFEETPGLLWLSLIAIGGAGNALLVGTDSDNSTATDYTCFEFVLPKEYQADADAKLVVSARYNGTGTPSVKTIDAVVYELADDDTHGSDLCATAEQSVTGSFANYTFTITDAGLAPGDRLLVFLKTTITTGETAAGRAEIGGIQMQLDIKG